jgi:hypothetical protein
MSSTTMYLDFDSTYRNRRVDPNPGSFTIYFGKSNATNALTAENPYSNQTLSYPPTALPQITLFPDVIIRDNPYLLKHTGILPFMFSIWIDQVGQPQIIIQLDTVPFSTSVGVGAYPDYLGLDFDDILRDPLVCSLELGQNYYVNQYLEDVLSGTFRRIKDYVVSERPSVNVTFFQSGQVAQVLPPIKISELYLFAPNQIFEIEDRNGDWIPLSNIDNFYRGKILKMISGAAKGEERIVLVSGIEYIPETDPVTVTLLTVAIPAPPPNTPPVVVTTITVVSTAGFVAGNYIRVKPPAPSFDLGEIMLILNVNSGTVFTVRRGNPYKSHAINDEVELMRETKFLAVDKPFENTVADEDVFVFESQYGYYVRLEEPFPPTVTLSQYPAFKEPLPPPNDPPFFFPKLGRPYRIRPDIPLVVGLTDYVIDATYTTITLPAPPAFTDPKMLIGNFVWVRNAYTTSNTDFVNSEFLVVNDIRIISGVDNTVPGQVTLTVTSAFTYNLGDYIGLPFALNYEWEIIAYTDDSVKFYNPPNNVITSNDMCCYEVTLVSLSIPNKILATGDGNLPAFYNYFYVELLNVSGASGLQKNTIYSNNPNATRVLFKVPIDNVNQPERAAFVLLTPDMTQVVKFKMLDSFKLTIYLPNGEVFVMTQSDNPEPVPPNSSLQVSALFSIRKL